MYGYFHYHPYFFLCWRRHAHTIECMAKRYGMCVCIRDKVSERKKKSINTKSLSFAQPTIIMFSFFYLFLFSFVFNSIFIFLWPKTQINTPKNKGGPRAKVKGNSLGKHSKANVHARTHSFFVISIHKNLMMLNALIISIILD